MNNKSDAKHLWEEITKLPGEKVVTITEEFQLSASIGKHPVKRRRQNTWYVHADGTVGFHDVLESDDTRDQKYLDSVKAAFLTKLGTAKEVSWQRYDS